ncbi:aminoglycoside phosphotransferase [Streptomyces violaceusniger Tu 4113]|uniref:Aminoglycoside phosphotransferase n=2 Tax=Streptomyces violaceusniger TaxID=68280 RepID=G2P154_STRV4|nr:aminoglycoside phosphotransferase [Streptomyces violaceusniger Tu 4113]
MHADERPIDVALVRRLLAAQFPRWAELPIERFASSGTVNALFRLGGDLAVRLPRLAGGAGDVEREHRWLPRLAPALPVPIPAVLGKGVPGDGFPWPWTVHRWLDGENPREGRVVRPGRLAADLAEFIVALRRIEPAGGPPAYRGGPLREVDEETRAAIGLLRGTIDTGAATAVWEEALAAPGWDGPPVWVHSDLMPGNLLVVDGRLSAVIDFGTAGVGDPACDLIPAWNLLPASVREDFRAALGVGVDDGTWARGRGWALSMALIQLPYYRETNPAMAANARHVIQEVLASTSRAPLAVETGEGSP